MKVRGGFSKIREQRSQGGDTQQDQSSAAGQKGPRIVGLLRSQCTIKGRSEHWIVRGNDRHCSSDVKVDMRIARSR